MCIESKYVGLTFHFIILKLVVSAFSIFGKRRNIFVVLLLPVLFSISKGTRTMWLSWTMVVMLLSSTGLSDCGAPFRINCGQFEPNITFLGEDSRAFNLEGFDKDNAITARGSWMKLKGKLLQALLREHGFVYLSGHGISPKIICRAFVESSNFFALPPSIKARYAMDSNYNNNGYIGPYTIRDNNPSRASQMRENYDVRGPIRRYPDEICPGFRSAIESLEMEGTVLTKSVIKLLTYALDLNDSNDITNLAMNLDNPRIPHLGSMRTLLYPQDEGSNEIGNDSQHKGTVRLAPHTDFGLLSLIYQDQVGGLEIKNGHGKWKKVEPIPGSVLLITGEMTEVLSAGEIKAGYHRILMENIAHLKNYRRQSIVHLVTPDDHAIMKPLKKSEPTENQSLTSKEYFDSRPLRKKMEKPIVGT